MSELLFQPPPREAGRESVLNAERNFYRRYPWCLNPYPTVGETVEHFRVEIGRLGEAPEGWQGAEVMTNVYLLSCALLNAVDDYLRGGTFRLPRRAARVPLLGRALRAAEKLTGMLSLRRRRRLRRWREEWQPAFDDLVALLVAGKTPDPKALPALGARLAERLPPPLPAGLRAEHIYFPSAFRKHDLTPHDVVSLGRLFIGRFPDRSRPLLVIGLRSAGSYFAPVLRAFLKAEGYLTVEAVTVRPDRGLGKEEREHFSRCARASYTALVLDDAPGTGDTIALAVNLARRAGFGPDRLAVLVPVHPASRDWITHLKSLPLADTVLIELAAEDWHKHRLLESQSVEERIAEYYQDRGFPRVRVSAGPQADQLNAELHEPTEEPRRNRLKRVHEVHLQTAEGREETRHVLAKSVGWGWLGYHAFLAADGLTGLVPPLLGLRDGILYTEWLPRQTGEDRERRIDTAASYVAARVRALSLNRNPLPSLGLHQHHDSFGLLDKVLSKAYGGTLIAGLMRPSVRRRLANLPCPVPTLIDGKMQPSEWLAGPGGPLKTDFEHHGMGKNELNLVDPAYDLAESILHLALSPEEEGRLLRRYAKESGDAGIGDRLLLNKVFAGTWALASALKHLFCQPQLTHRQQEFHEQFVAAWHFLTVQAARACGDLCRPAEAPRWGAPLVVLDLDGVLDRRLLGFPHTTAAGIDALGLLHAHGFAVAVNTARCVPEVQEYCRAYGFAGGLAEYGSYAWDAASRQGRVLVSPEALDQLERARAALRQLPGVFLDDRYHYSIRAVTYEDKSPPVGRALTPYNLSSIRSCTLDEKSPAPLPTLTVQHILADLRLDALTVHQTTIDTTIVAREADKGRGLSALLGWIGVPANETTAIGDSEPDLPMFRVAGRSFAPSQLGCGSLARMLGCKVVRRPSQRGLLDVARILARERPVGRKGEPPRIGPGLFWDLLRAADRPRFARLLRALLNPRLYQVFLR